MCKTNNEKFWPSKSSFAHDIPISWLYYGHGDIKIRDTFVYEHILPFPEEKIKRWKDGNKIEKIDEKRTRKKIIERIKNEQRITLSRNFRKNKE